ncbi:MAG: pilus assembly PilX family protein [Pirellulaceae bacterium]
MSIRKSLPYIKETARRLRRGAAMMTALFVMTVSSVLVISIMDTETLQYSALRNTMDWDRARYLAEAGLQHALAELEADITWRTGIGNTQFPAGSGNLYWATAANGANGTVVVTAWGQAGNVTRKLETMVKQGG